MPSLLYAFIITIANAGITFMTLCHTCSLMLQPTSATNRKGLLVCLTMPAADLHIGNAH